VQDIVHCLLGLPLLPADDISPAFDELKLAVSSSDGQKLTKKLLTNSLTTFLS